MRPAPRERPARNSPSERGPICIGAILSPASPHLPSGREPEFLSSERQSRSKIPHASARSYCPQEPRQRPHASARRYAPAKRGPTGADKSAECRGIVSMLFCAPTRCRRRGSFTSSEDERLDKGLLIRRAGCGKVASPDLWGRRRATAASTRPLGARQGTSQMGGIRSFENRAEPTHPSWTLRRNSDQAGGDGLWYEVRMLRWEPTWKAFVKRCGLLRAGSEARCRSTNCLRSLEYLA